MDFIKQMKKREFIEMGLKTLASVLAAFLAIILMEGMIYSIKLNALKTKGNGYTVNGGSTIAYCIKESEDKYFVIYYNDDENSPPTWAASKNERLSKDDCEKLSAVVKFHAPNAFDFSITSTHYIVMTLFISAVVGFFAYKFIALSRVYKKTEEQYLKTGTIEITNI